MSAHIHTFEADSFIINERHCSAPGPKANLMCFAEKGHEGDHVWRDWRGCRIRTPLGIVRFGGFTQ